MSVQEMKERQRVVAEKRTAILQAVAAAKQTVDEIQRRLSGAVNERNRLQKICVDRELAGREEPPLEEFARAVLLADEIALKLIDVEKIAAAAEANKDANLRNVENEEAKLRREIAMAQLREKIVAFEIAVQNARLGHLSDEIIRFARDANVNVEQHSPLITTDYLLICGYPIKAWEQSAVGDLIRVQRAEESIQADARPVSVI